jgi:hypothetical protein
MRNFVCKTNLAMRSFDTWNYEQVEDAFGLSQVKPSPLLDDWLRALGCEPTALKTTILDNYRELLLEEAQNWNEDELKLFFILPIYGCYVSGRNWFFVLLQGNVYGVSNAFNASDDDIYQIFAILKKCKLLVDTHAQAS